MRWERRSIRAMAKALKRSPSSVSRELRRNFPPERKVYTPRLANDRALRKRKSRGRQDRLKSDRIREYVATHLKRRWSPEQIAGRIKTDLGQTISHEAIYQYIYAQIHRDGWEDLKPDHEDLRPYLRRRRKRRQKKGMRRCQRIFKPKGASINERPSVVAERRRIGDWEGDTVESVNRKPGVNTLVERKTGLFFITKLSNRTSQAANQAIASRLNILPTSLRRSLTLDNGPENQDWQGLEHLCGLKCFFAHPYHSWERGSNENANDLLRNYFPKKTDFTAVSEQELSLVEYELNSRPRKRLNWLTPLEAFSKELDQFNITIKVPNVALVG